MKLIHGTAGLITTTVLAALTPGVAVGTAATAPNGRAHTAVRRIHVAALTVPLPAGWYRVVHRGNYRDCSNPIGVLALASYRLVGHGNHEGPTVVPANGILLELSSLPIRSGARPWRRWRLSNHELQPTRTVGPNRYAAVVQLPSSPAVVASAWFGSIPAPPSALAAVKSDPSKRADKPNLRLPMTHRRIGIALLAAAAVAGALAIFSFGGGTPTAQPSVAVPFSGRA